MKKVILISILANDRQNSYKETASDIAYIDICSVLNCAASEIDMPSE